MLFFDRSLFLSLRIIPRNAFLTDIATSFIYSIDTNGIRIYVYHCTVSFFVSAKCSFDGYFGIPFLLFFYLRTVFKEYTRVFSKTLFCQIWQYCVNYGYKI